MIKKKQHNVGQCGCMFHIILAINVKNSVYKVRIWIWQYKPKAKPKTGSKACVILDSEWPHQSNSPASNL